MDNLRVKPRRMASIEAAKKITQKKAKLWTDSDPK
jgi:hypothetical protein